MNWGLLWTAVGAAATVVATLAAAGALVMARLKEIRAQNVEQLRKQDEFNDDWYGQPARPGRAAEPGVMERLVRIESNTASLPDRVAAVEQRQDTAEQHRYAIEKRLDDHIHGHSGPPIQ